MQRLDYSYHIPVMVNEVISLLRPERGGIYVDCTMGGGGHTEKILEAVKHDGLVIGLDQDSDALQFARNRLQASSLLKIVKGNFGDLKSILHDLSIDRIDGALLDLGVSSHQLDAAERGFSFKADAPLDMRMDRETKLNCADLINSASKEELVKIFREYGEEHFAAPIARGIVNRRAKKPINSTGELVESIIQSLPAAALNKKIHPATRVFMALRIAVNDELSQLQKSLTSIIEMLNDGGRVVVISYHSLEDRIVKRIFNTEHRKKDPIFGNFIENELGYRISVITKKPLVPNEAEIASNPRSRSAKVRCAEVIRSGG